MSEQRLFLILLLILPPAISFSSVEKLSGDPYGGIVLRNAFGLAANKTEAVLPPPVPAPKVQLLGITTMLGDKRVIVKVLWPAKPGEPVREQTFVLKNHQIAGEIEVLGIDELAATVRVRISSSVKTLSFESDKGASRVLRPALL